MSIQIKILICSFWIISIFSTWFVTKESVKPEKVIVTQEKIIYQLKSDIQVQKIKEAEQFLIKIPFTDIGITKQFTLGAITDRVLMVVFHI